MRLRKGDRLRKNAELKTAREANPEARVEMKRDGLEVGKLVRYIIGKKNPDWAAHVGTVTKLHHNSVEVIMTGGNLGAKYADTILREDEIPYSQVKEILGPGRIPMRATPEPKKISPPPPRPEGYENCDIGDCESRPVMAYIIKKYDAEIGKLGPAHIVAVCSAHDEKYEEATGQGKNYKPATIPMLWQMGVVFESWKIPKPESVEPTVDTEPESVKPTPVAKSKPTVTKSTSPYEGKRGRHPTDCKCSKHVGRSA